MISGRGFSLLETLAASALIFVILGVVAVQVSDTANILRRSTPREKLLEAIEMGCERICSETASALELLNPTSGTSSTLTFTRLDPAAPRLPNPLPEPLPAAWDHRNPNHILTVTYQISEGRLERLTSSSSFSTHDSLCGGMSGLSATVLDPSSVQIRLSVEVNGELKTVTKEAFLWIAR